ncbi:TetR/AcrR family transcriptional regulator [Leucobacter musarum]|uniref:TetR/AcrR family transcriptional regulator n=1 Tax=Leucobacter musarum TaxID=1930747 RepID=UPI0006A7A6F7|nr:TetR family transcriptional regulator [Leucobacter musarum]
MNAETATQAAPRRRDPEGRRRAILEAATAIIVEQGPAALTHRAVAARASVPLGSTTQYFTSIDDLRESALQALADEIDEALARLEPLAEHFIDDPGPVVDEMLRYLSDERTVHADIALMTAGTTDERLRALALRWPERLIEILGPCVGEERAIAIAVFLDGATMHAGLTRAPLSRDQIMRTLTALATMPVPDPAT